MIRKIEKYYRLKKMKDVLDTQIQTLNKDIKESLEPGEHSVGPYRVTILLNSSLHIDKVEEEEILVQEDLQRNSKR